MTPTPDAQALKKALEAVEFCLSVIHNPKTRPEDNAIWSTGTSSKPRITEEVLETIRSALTAALPDAGEEFNPEIHDECEGCRCVGKVAIATKFTDDDVGFCDWCWELFWRDCEIERLREAPPQAQTAANTGPDVEAFQGIKPTYNGLQGTEPDVRQIDDLAQFIRINNLNQTVAASELAEKILGYLSERNLPSAGDGWQDISTAPNSKKPILVFVPGTGNGVIYVGWKSLAGKYIVFDTGRGENASVYPSHWMPLPASPPQCDICKGSGVVCTTDNDHEGQPIEARCPCRTHLSAPEKEGG